MSGTLESESLIPALIRQNTILPNLSVTPRKPDSELLVLTTSLTASLKYIIAITLSSALNYKPPGFTPHIEQPTSEKSTLEGVAGSETAVSLLVVF